jgi:hypothetical protein
VCAFAVLRLGEVSALQVSDVDFLRRELHVRRQVQWKSGDRQMDLRPPKYGSERTVCIPDGLVAILTEHVRQFRPGTDPDRWLFPGGRDESQPIHVGMVSRDWAAARDRAGISYRLHDLRHFYASGLIAAGSDVVTVQRWGTRRPPPRWPPTATCGRTLTTGPAGPRVSYWKPRWVPLRTLLRTYCGRCSLREIVSAAWAVSGVALAEFS